MNCVPLCDKDEVAPGCEKKSTEESSICGNDFEQTVCVLNECGMLGLTQHDVKTIRLQPCEYIEVINKINLFFKKK